MDKRLSKNLILNMTYNILSIIVPFITAPYLGRILGAEQVGAYTYIYSVSSYFVMVGILGVSNYGTRTIAKVRDDRYARSKCFWEIYSMQLLTASIAATGYIFYSMTLSKQDRVLSIIMVFFVFSSLVDTAWYFYGMERFKAIVFRNVIIKVINLICIFTFVTTKADLAKYALIMAVGYLVSPLALWPTTLKDVDFLKPKWIEMISHFKPNFMLFIPAAAASIYQIMDKVMIGAISNKEQLAYYEYADKIIGIPNVIFGAIGAVMLSRMSNVVNNDEKKVVSMIGMSMDLSFLISVGFAFGVAAVSEEFVNIYYGQSFQSSSIILTLLAPTVIFYGFNNVLRMQYLIPKNLDSIYIQSVFAGAAVNLILNLMFIPYFHALGATIGTIAAQLTITLFYSFQIYKELPLKSYLQRNIWVIFIGLIMFLVIKVVQIYHEISLIGLIIDVSVGMIVYLILCVLLAMKQKQPLLRLIYEKTIQRYIKKI